MSARTTRRCRLDRDTLTLEQVISAHQSELLLRNECLQVERRANLWCDGIRHVSRRLPVYEEGISMLFTRTERGWSLVDCNRLPFLVPDTAWLRIGYKPMQILNLHANDWSSIRTWNIRVLLRRSMLGMTRYAGYMSKTYDHDKSIFRFGRIITLLR
jgi:hypothetical protein